MKATVKLMAMAAAMTAFASCTSMDSAYDPNKVAAQKQAQYQKAFEQAFGTIDPNNDWGLASAKARLASAGTRSTYNDDNNLYSIVDYNTLPEVVTDELATEVYQYFNSLTDEESDYVNWSDYFVQQVYADIDKKMQDANEQEFYVNAQLDENGNVKQNGQISDLLYCTDGTSSGVKIDNFQNGYCSRKMNIASYQNQPTSERERNEDICLVQAGTTNLGYLNSRDGTKYYFNTNCSQKVCLIKEYKGYYYAGFRFFAEGPNNSEKVENKDGKFTDWIVRITPATYTSSASTRVMCEDMGTTGDFDFNDVVFDVYDPESWNSSGQYVITLQAAGAEYDIYIGGTEVHEAFGVEKKKMVNTGAGAVNGVPVAIFRIAKPSNGLEGIQIIVDDGNSKTAGVEYIKSAETGATPQILYVKTDCKTWSKEKVRIDTTFPNFTNYVKNASANEGVWWEPAYDGYNQ